MYHSQLKGNRKYICEWVGNFIFVSIALDHYILSRTGSPPLSFLRRRFPGMSVIALPLARPSPSYSPFSKLLFLSDQSKVARAIRPYHSIFT